MAKKRKNHSTKFKATVALAAIKQEYTLAELSKKFNIHSSQIQRWKRQVLDSLPDIFSKSAGQTEEKKDQEIDDLYRHIGQLKVELDWLKKKSGLEY